MNRYVKKRKLTNNGKYKYIYYRINTSGKKRISSKEYYSHKNKQIGGTNNVEETEKRTVEEIATDQIKALLKSESKKRKEENKNNPTLNKIILMKKTKENINEAHPVPITPLVRKVIQADKNILPLLHLHGLDPLFKPEEDIVINGKPYITYRVNSNTIKRVKEIAGNDLNTIEYFDRNIDEDVYMWNYKSTDKIKMRSEGIGIFDPKGMFPNPLNGKKFSSKYKKLADSNWNKEGNDITTPIKESNKASGWAHYPFYKYCNELQNLIHNNQVVLVRAGTGAGKTVLAPKVALHYTGYGKKGRVIVTLPKRILTQSSALYAAATLDVRIGEQVGYKYSSSDIGMGTLLSDQDKAVVTEMPSQTWIDGKKSDKKSTKILYATDGSLINFLNKYPTLQNNDGDNVWDIVVIDEVHERNARIDYIIMKMKYALRENSSLKFILMSATIDPKPYETYFQEFKFADLFVPGTTPKEKIDIWIKPKINHYDEGETQIKRILDNEIDEDDDADLDDDEYDKMQQIKELYAELDAKDIQEITQIQNLDDRMIDPNAEWKKKLDDKIEELDDVTDVEILNKKGSILWILPSVGNESNPTRPVKKICNKLYDYTDKMHLNTKVFCTDLSRGTSAYETQIATHLNMYKMIEEPRLNNHHKGPWGRKIVLSTPIAESSLTIKGLTYVIDSGLEIKVKYDAESDLTHIGTEYTSKAQAAQRWGRVGRTEPGVAIRLYDKETFKNEFPDWPIPEILKVNPIPHVFKLIDYLEEVNKLTDVPEYQYNQIYNLDYVLDLMSGIQGKSIYLEPFPADTIENIKKIFAAYDFVDGDSGYFTLPFYIVKTIYVILDESLPNHLKSNLRMEHARFIAESFIFDCTDEAIKLLCASLTIGNRGLQTLFHNKFGLQQYPRRGKMEKSDYEELCTEIERSNSDFYKIFKKRFGLKQRLGLKSKADLDDAKIFNRESDHITLLNLTNKYIHKIKEVKKDSLEITYFNAYPKFVKWVTGADYDDQNKVILEWAEDHGLNIKTLESITNSISEQTNSFVFAFRRKMNDVARELKTKSDNTSNIKISKEFIKVNKILLENTNDFDYAREFYSWYKSSNNKTKFASEIHQIFDKFRVFDQNNKFDFFLQEKMDDLLKAKGITINMTTEQVNDKRIENIFGENGKGQSLKYKLVAGLLNVFNFEHSNNKILRATILELRDTIINIEETYTSNSTADFGLRNIITYALYSNLSFKEGKDKMTQQAIPEIIVKSTSSSIHMKDKEPEHEYIKKTLKEKKAKDNQTKSYNQLISDYQKKKEQKKNIKPWVHFRIFGKTIPKAALDEEKNYMQYIRGNIDAIEDEREKRDEGLKRCIFAGLRKNIAQRIPDLKEEEKENKNSCPNITRVKFKNCFPTKSVTFEVDDLSATTFIDLEQKKKTENNYIAYDYLTKLDFGREIVNVSLLTKIPRVYLTFGGNKYLPNNLNDAECSLITDE